MRSAIYHPCLPCVIIFVYFAHHLANFAYGQATIEVGNSINPVGSGARAMGQGNAFIAVADDATAASWNPAGLTQLERPEFSFAVEYFSRIEDLNSSLNRESKGSDSVDLFDFNYASAVVPFHFKTNMVFSLNYLRLFRFDKSLDFPVRFPAEIEDDLDVAFDFDYDQDGSLSVVAPAFAFDVTDNLSLGVTLNIWNHSVTGVGVFESRKTSQGTLTSYGTTDQFNFVEKERFEVEEGYSAVIGITYRLGEEWNFGMVIKPEFRLDIDHEISRREIQTGEGGTRDDPRHDLKNSKLEFPTIIGGGISWRPNDQLTVSSDVTWTDWSEYNLHEREDFKANKTDFNPISGTEPDAGKSKDTFTVRMGCEYLLLREKYIVPLRLGFGYDPSPAVGEVDDFYTASVGSGLQIGSYNFDIAYEFRWGNGVNSDLFPTVNADQDIYQHRVLASLIYYF